MKRVALVMLLFVCSRMDAAFEHLMKGSNVIATGGASTAILNNPWAAFCSPGALSSIPGRVASFYYSPQPFGLKELSHGSFSYVEPTALGAFALSGSRFGFELYREVDVQLSFGRGVNDMFSVGGSVHYCHLSIERYGSAHTFAVDVGTLARFTDRVQWGFTAFNVNGASIGAARERLPQVFVTGIAYLPVPEAMLVADLEKDIRYAVQLHAGVQYSLLDVIALRAGTTTDPSILSAGLGIHYSLLQLDYAFTNHEDLGPTHQVSLSLLLGSF